MELHAHTHTNAEQLPFLVNSQINLTMHTPPPLVSTADYKLTSRLQQAKNIIWPEIDPPGQDLKKISPITDCLT